MVNDLNAAMTQVKDKDILGSIFDKLIKYTATHFAYEEKLFETHSFPGMAAHKIEHKNLVTQALDLQKNLRKANLYSL